MDIKSMNSQQQEHLRQQLLTIFTKAIQAVEGASCVATTLAKLSLPTAPVKVVAIGKAAQSMLCGAHRVLGERIHAGLLVTKLGYLDATKINQISYLEAGHPIPSERSLVAGDQLIQFVEQVQAHETLLLLISGGTSALVEVLSEGFNLQNLIELNQWCLSHALNIQQVNRLRKLISQIKNGGLLNFIHSENIVQLSISDVENNDLSVIGSGLLVSDAKSYAMSSLPDIPAWLRNSPQQPAPRQMAHAQQFIIADNAKARKAAIQSAQLSGMECTHEDELFGESSTVAKIIYQQINSGNKGFYVWGGEWVVELPASPGQGGRCQHLALQLAQLIEDQNICMLICATDGSDGPGDVAGAMIDGSTIARGKAHGIEAELMLQQADSGGFFEALGDLIDTGPTGTNVMDLVLGIKY